MAGAATIATQLSGPATLALLEFERSSKRRKVERNDNNAPVLPEENCKGDNNGPSFPGLSFPAIAWPFDDEDEDEEVGNDNNCLEFGCTLLGGVDSIHSSGNDSNKRKAAVGGLKRSMAFETDLALLSNASSPVAQQQRQQPPSPQQRQRIFTTAEPFKKSLQAAAAKALVSPADEPQLLFSEQEEQPVEESTSARLLARLAPLSGTAAASLNGYRLIMGSSNNAFLLQHLVLS